MPSDIGCSTHEHAIVLSSGSILDYTGAPINLPVPYESYADSVPFTD